MAKFDEMIGKVLLITLVVVGMFSFIILYQVENDATDPLSGDPLFNKSYQDLVSNINDSTRQGQQKYDSFNSEEPQEGLGSIILFSIVAVGKSFSSILFGSLLTAIKLPLIVFGIPQEVFNIVITWLIIGVVVALWALYNRN